MYDGYSQSTYILWLKSKLFASNMLVIFTGTSCFKLASSFVDNNNNNDRLTAFDPGQPG